MKTVKIDRSKWQRGGEAAVLEKYAIDDVTLWNLDEGCGCCLGHVLHQAHGVSYKKMSMKGTPVSLAEETGEKNPLVKRVEQSHYRNFDEKSFSEQAMDYNDKEDYDFTEEQREDSLIRLGKDHGYDLSFFN